MQPDDEMVEGYKGRYFELSLKNADKNASILFPVGKYYMDKQAFRTKYGATIGSFVSEALYQLKDADTEQIRLFIQGGADIVGSETFRGQMNNSYLYESVDILPLTDGVHFGHDAVAKNIPKANFRNDDLPDLRGQYLKEIIGLYTDKFNPVLLQGVVTDTEDAKKRNATIYLFFPDAVLAGQ